jgi:hypothetical protein
MRGIAWAAAVATVVFVAGCEPGTIDTARAGRPDLTPRPVPAAAGPTTIPAGLRLPDEGTTPPNGTDWVVIARTTTTRSWPLEPCLGDTSRSQPAPVHSDQRAITRTLPDGVNLSRTLQLYADTQTATGLMAGLRRGLTDCFAGTRDGTTWVWQSRDLTDIGDDAVEVRGRYESRDMVGNLIGRAYLDVVVQVRNAVVVVCAAADEDRQLPDSAGLRSTAAEAVDTLHRFGWP